MILPKLPYIFVIAFGERDYEEGGLCPWFRRLVDCGSIHRGVVEKGKWSQFCENEAIGDCTSIDKDDYSNL